MRARFVLVIATAVVMAGLVVRVGVQGPNPVPGAPEPDLFDLRRISDGVYAAIAKPVYKINCNAAVIVLDDGVLVVDTHSKPSAARSLMNQIKTVTPKPVKYVVDTHFHWDHAQGNSAYPAAWPQGVEIISSEATRESIEQRGIPRVKYELLALPREIASLKSQLTGATEPARRATLENNLRQAESYFAELGSLQTTLPSLTFDRSLVIHGKSRTVQLLWLGRAHTDGDVFVYSPQDKFVATGDALHGWTPFMADSHPAEWIRTLKALEQLDVETMLGGHGDVMRGKTHLQAWVRYLTDLVTETTNVYAAGASLADAVTRVSATLVPRHAASMPATFRQDITGNIQKVYRVVSGQMQ